MDITFTKTFAPLERPAEFYTLGVGQTCRVVGADYVGDDGEELLQCIADNVLVLCRQVEGFRRRHVPRQFGGIDEAFAPVCGGEPEALIFRNAEPGEIYVWLEGDGLHYCLIGTRTAKEITKKEAHRTYVGEDSFYSELEAVK